MTIQLTPRDHELMRAAWSLGAATSLTLRALVSPASAPKSIRNRLRALTLARCLSITRYVAPDGSLFLYSAGPQSVLPGEPRPWRPGLAQIQHTLDVGSAVIALTRPHFGGLKATTWQGEAEIRAWAEPGAPFPDARIDWTTSTAHGVWLIEVDRATESRAAWRRKLVRYLTHPSDGLVLALTTSHARAVNLATVAGDVGVPLLATTLREAQSSIDPRVLDTRTRRKSRLSQAIADGCAKALRA